MPREPITGDPAPRSPMPREPKPRAPVLRAPLPRGRLLFTAALLLVSLFLFRETLSLSVPGRAAPIRVLVPVIVLLLVLIEAELREARRSRGNAASAPETASRALREGVVVGGAAWSGGGQVGGGQVAERTVRLFGWIALLLTAVYLVGYFPALPLFLVPYLLREARMEWRRALLLAAVLTTGVYLVFGVWVELPFPDSLFGSRGWSVQELLPGLR